MHIDRKQLINDLRQTVAEVRFHKVDGTLRIMNCTLQSRYLPERDPAKVNETVEREQNEKLLTVWDVDHQAWRSFHLDKVVSCQVKDGY